MSSGSRIKPILLLKDECGNKSGREVGWVGANTKMPKASSANDATGILASAARTLLVP